MHNRGGYPTVVTTTFHPPLDADTNRRGRGLLDAVATGISGTRSERARRHDDGGPRYKVGLRPGSDVPVRDLGRAEHARGPPPLAREPVPCAEKVAPSWVTQTEV